MPFAQSGSGSRRTLPRLRRRGKLRWGPAAWPAGAGLVFCAVVLWALAGNLVNPHFGASRYRMDWTLAAGAAFLLVSAALCLLLDRPVPGRARHRGWKTAAGVLTWSVLLVVQLRVAYAVRLPPDWDVHGIHESAGGLADGSMDAVTPYFRINPNNLLLTLLLARYDAGALALGVKDLAAAAAFLNGVILFLATVLTYLTARMMGGPVAAALTVLPATVFLGFSPWAGVLYSDTVGTLFTVLILFLLVASCRTRRTCGRVALWVLAGGLGAIGVGIKPTVAICLIAAGVTVACLLVRRKNTAVLLAASAVVAGSFILGNRLIAAFLQRTPVVGFDPGNSPDAMNPGHFLKVGAQTAQGPYGPLYGSYNQFDYEQTLAIRGSSEKFHAGLDAYLDRVGAMGPGGYLRFLNDKLLWVTGDGSFFTWGEGRLTGRDFLSTAAADRWLQDLFNNTGPHFQWMLSVWQGTWFAVLLLVALPLLLRTPFLMRPDISALRIALLGLLMFVLLFEGRARFLYLYSPFFIVLAALSCQAVVERLRKGKYRAPPGTGAEVIE